MKKDNFERYFNNPGGLDHGDSGEKWLNSECVLNIELTGLACALNV